MKVAITKPLVLEDFRRVPKGTIGEPLCFYHGEDDTVTHFDVIFYGLPGTYLVKAADLEVV